jgi:hypothetical protein
VLGPKRNCYSAGNCSRGRGPKMGPLGGRQRGPEMAHLLVQGGSASVQASSPSSQVKAAVGQVGDRN